MALSFSKLKTLGLPHTSVKFSKLAKERKLPSISISKPKVLSVKNKENFNFSKFTKVKKIPKAKKVAIIKKAIKKVKNVGF